MRRFIPALGLLVLLAGCSSGPRDDDVAEWSQWPQDLAAGAHDGSAVLTGRAAESANGSTGLVRLPEPLGVTGIQLACTGAARMTIAYELVASAASDNGNAEIECDGVPHQASIPPAVSGQQVRSASVVAVSDDGAGAWGLVLTP